MKKLACTLDQEVALGSLAQSCVFTWQTLYMHLLGCGCGSVVEHLPDMHEALIQSPAQ